MHFKGLNHMHGDWQWSNHRVSSYKPLRDPWRQSQVFGDDREISSADNGHAGTDPAAAGTVAAAVGTPQTERL